MRHELKQQRDSIIRKIQENSTVVTISRLPMVDDHMGGLTPDPSGTPTPTTMTVRLSHEQSAVPDNSAVPAGTSTNLNRFILSSYSDVIYENETFEAIGKEWRVGPVDPVWASGGIIGYQAPLLEAVT